MPEPQVADAELEEIAKIGQTGSVIRSMVDGRDTASVTTGQLLNEYSSSMAMRLHGTE